MELDLDLFGKLHAGIDELNAHMRRQSALLARLSDVPTDVIYRANGVTVGTAAMVFQFPNANVEPGYVFVGRRWVVGGVNWGDTRAGTALLYQGPQTPNLNSLDIGSIVAVVSSMPGIQYFSSRQLVMRNGDALWTVISGTTTSNAQYNSHVAGEIYKDGGLRAETDW